MSARVCENLIAERQRKLHISGGPPVLRLLHFINLGLQFCGQGRVEFRENIILLSRRRFILLNSVNKTKIEPCFCEVWADRQAFQICLDSLIPLVVAKICSPQQVPTVRVVGVLICVVNKTGYALREVYLSPAHKTKWGNDRLGNNTLDNNKSRLFKFADKASCVQDLLVVFDDDGSEVTWEDFNLCELNKITLKYNRKSKVVSADTE